MADEHARLPSSLPLDQAAARPHLTKQTLASHDVGYGVSSENAATRPEIQHIASQFNSFDSSGSSSSKPLFTFHDTLSPTLLSQTQTPDSELSTPPKLVQSPRPAYFPSVYPHAASSTAASLLQSGELSEPAPQLPVSSPLGTSESEDYGGPTRASIRAWAKATPAGPPKGPSARNTSELQSSRSSPELPQPLSTSEENLHAAGLNRAVRDLPVSVESSEQRTSSRSGGNSPRMSLDRENSGNVADGESSESDQVSRSPPSVNPPLDEVDELKLAAQRELTAPHPHPSSLPSHSKSAYAHLQTPRARHNTLAHPHATTHQHSHPHPHGYPRSSPRSRSSPESSPPASVAVPVTVPVPATPPPAHPDPQALERAERRHHHHHRHHRRRHRDRDREREGARERRSRGHSNIVSVPALPPLRPLKPPPPPLQPLRTLPVPRSPGSGSGTDMFEEIVKLLKTARTPVLRTTRAGTETETDGSDAGWLPFPRARSDGSGGGSGGVAGGGSGSRGRRRENDVLEDIRRMIHWSRGG